jgi:glycosyltransferase involved in cell wall biosynthesis
MASISIKVLYLGYYTYPQGSASAKRVQYQAEFLHKSNVNVCIVIPKKGGLGVFNEVPYSYGKLNAFIRIFKFKEKDKSNIIVLQTLIGVKELIYVLFAKIMGYKVVLDKVESFNYLEDRMSFEQMIDIKFGLFFEKFLKWFANGFLVISTLLYKKYKEFGKPILLMPNSVPLSLISENQKIKFNDPVRIVYTGSYGKKDGVEYLIRAYKKLVKSYGNIELHLIGNGTLENNKRIKNEIGPFQTMIFEHGFVEEQELQQIILSADILAVTRTNSKFANYGFPYKITEYLCKGNPILATQVGDLALYFEDKKNIIFAKAEDIDSLYYAMEFCIKNEAQVIRIGKKGQKVIETFFSIEKNGKLVIDFFLAV